MFTISICLNPQREKNEKVELLGCYIKKCPDLEPTSLNHAKYFLKTLLKAISIIRLSFVTKWCTTLKINSTMHSTLSTNTHHNVRTFNIDGMAQNIKVEYFKNRTWLLLEMKKNIKLSLKNYTFRWCHFLAEVMSKFSDPFVCCIVPPSNDQITTYFDFLTCYHMIHCL